MSPFWDFLKQYSHFTWNQNFDNVFGQSKQIIVGLEKKGVMTFDTNRVTCLALEHIRHGFSAIAEVFYMPKKAQIWCPEGWFIIFASTRLCTNTEHQYAPVVGEAAAIT